MVSGKANLLLERLSLVPVTLNSGKITFRIFRTRNYYRLQPPTHPPPSPDKILDAPLHTSITYYTVHVQTCNILREDGCWQQQAVPVHTFKNDYLNFFL